MSNKTDSYLKDIPLKPYDLIREGLVVLSVVFVVVVVLAALFGSPDYPTVRAQDVANADPLALVRTGVDILAGNSSLQDYGPPYSANPENAQQVLNVAPADWFGVTHPIDPSSDLVLNPLQRAAFLNNDVKAALNDYQSATDAQRQEWLASYTTALDSATVSDGQVLLPAGQYGPVAPLMQGLLDLGRSGLLEGALESGSSLPYRLDSTRSLLFFQDGVDHKVAQQLDMLGEQWGMSHETGNYPGGWWLWPVVFLYQVPSIANSANADLLAGLIAAVGFMALFFLPFIPLLRDVPKRLAVHKIIWRDWYAQAAKPAAKHGSQDRIGGSR